jgi:hypothetical protein
MVAFVRSAASRVLILLAPAIVETILDGRQPAAMTLSVLMRPFVVGWERNHGLPTRYGAL